MLVAIGRCGEGGMAILACKVSGSSMRALLMRAKRFHGGELAITLGVVAENVEDVRASRRARSPGFFLVCGRVVIEQVFDLDAVIIRVGDILNVHASDQVMNLNGGAVVRCCAIDDVACSAQAMMGERTIQFYL